MQCVQTYNGRHTMHITTLIINLDLKTNLFDQHIPKNICLFFNILLKTTILLVLIVAPFHLINNNKLDYNVKV